MLACQEPPVTRETQPVTVTVAAPKLTLPTDRLSLRVSLEVPREKGGIFRIFAEHPKAGRNSSVEDERFIGYVTAMAGPAPKDPKKAEALNQVSVELPIPASFENWGRGKSTIRFTVIGMGEAEVKVKKLELALITDDRGVPLR